MDIVQSWRICGFLSVLGKVFMTQNPIIGYGPIEIHVPYSFSLIFLMSVLSSLYNLNYLHYLNAFLIVLQQHKHLTVYALCSVCLCVKKCRPWWWLMTIIFYALKNSPLSDFVALVLDFLWLVWVQFVDLNSVSGRISTNCSFFSVVLLILLTCRMNILPCKVPCMFSSDVKSLYRKGFTLSILWLSCDIYWNCLTRLTKN